MILRKFKFNNNQLVDENQRLVEAINVTQERFNSNVEGRYYYIKLFFRSCVFIPNISLCKSNNAIHIVFEEV